MGRTVRGSQLTGRVALMAGGLVLGLIFLEAALQVGAFVVRATGRELPSAWVSGRFRVLCIGDSNTYGLWLDRSDAYPQQLESQWNEEVEQAKAEVINLGIPGTNSSRMVRDFPRILEAFDPDLAIVMVGVNDFWTQPVEIGDAQSGGRNVIQRRSLVYKLYYLIARSFDARELEILMDSSPKEGGIHGADHVVRYGDEEFDMGFVQAKEGLWGEAQGLERNLTILSEQGEAFGVPLYFMTYPGRWSLYRSTNPIIIKVGEETGTPVIDLTSIFRTLCPQRNCPRYLFSDQHPNANGYRIVAETVVERLAGSGRI
jgi:lysophospholipase L1-like esterase